jgi:hypothetical protein
MTGWETTSRQSSPDPRRPRKGAGPSACWMLEQAPCPGASSIVAGSIRKPMGGLPGCAADSLTSGEGEWHNAGTQKPALANEFLLHMLCNVRKPVHLLS